MVAEASVRTFTKRLVIKVGPVNIEAICAVPMFLVMICGGLNGHHGLALRNEKSTHHQSFLYNPWAGLNGRYPSQTFLASAVPMARFFAVTQLIGMTQQSVNRRQQCIARFYDRATDADFHVGSDLADLQRVGNLIRVEKERLVS